LVAKGGKRSQSPTVNLRARFDHKGAATQTRKGEWETTKTTGVCANGRTLSEKKRTLPINLAG